MTATVIESRELLVPAAFGGGFVRAASGITRAVDASGDAHFVVVQDDTHELVVLDAAGDVVAIAPLAEEASRHAVSKDAKHDLESVFTVSGPPAGGVVALASGSRANRNGCFAWSMSAQNPPRRLGCAEEFWQQIGKLAAVHRIELNIEASGFVADEFWLINRGHLTAPSYVFAWSAQEGRAFAEDAVALRAEHARVFPFEEIFLDGARLTATDLCDWDGTTLVTLSAEATDNAYDDGSVLGSAIFALRAGQQSCGLIVDDAGNRLVAKVEGIAVCAVLEDEQLEAFCVTDPDDPNQASRLLRVRIAL